MILFRQSAMLHDSKPSVLEGFIFFKHSPEGCFGIKKRQIMPLLALRAYRKRFQKNYDNLENCRCASQGAEKRKA